MIRRRARTAPARDGPEHGSGTYDRRERWRRRCRPATNALSLFASHLATSAAAVAGAGAGAYDPASLGTG